MTNARFNGRSTAAGQVLVILIILVALIGGGVWYLYNNKNTMDRSARAFGKEAVQRLAVNYDVNYLNQNLGPQARLDMPPSQQAYIVSKFREMGVPAQPIKIDETVTFESNFFKPQAFFVAHLNYPAQPATLEIAVSHPVGKWQIDNLSVSWQKQR